MSGAHTPGPWAINGVVAPDDIADLKLEPAVTAGEFYVATAHDFGDSGATSAANARLIAAAPDLLAACEALDGALREQAPSPNAIRDPAIAAMRAAIAKASNGGGK